jgi:hypothetical protein
MRITLKDPELELDVYKVDTPTGTGWSIIMPDDRKILAKYHNGKWEANDVISEQFVQEIGYEINRILEADQRAKLSKNHSILNRRPKRARILKYFLM